jgi:pyruvate/2-oxoglutarate dehydrogenase complex dihydrolipoamide dehydrogenase (E3) component
MTEKGPDGQLRLSVKSSNELRTLVGSHLLLAVGRVPNSETLNLAAAGVQVDSRGFIEVSDRLETNVPGVYAMGDVKGGPALTHISYDDFRVLHSADCPSANDPRRPSPGDRRDARLHEGGRRR